MQALYYVFNEDRKNQTSPTKRNPLGPVHIATVVALSVGLLVAYANTHSTR